MKLNATQLSLLVKIGSVILAIGFNVWYLIMNKKLPSIEEQKSLLYLMAGMNAPLLTVDTSKVINNIRKVQK